MFQRGDTLRPVVATKEEPVKKHKITYTCDVCQKGDWLTETDVEIHRKNTHKNQLFKLLKNKNEHYCSVCVRPHNDAADLLRHIKSEHLFSPPDSMVVGPDIYICDDCERVFFNKKMLTLHIQRTHSTRAYRDSAKVECPVCSKDIRLATALMWSHLLFHSIIGISTCQICLEACENRYDLRNHLQVHAKYFSCYCGFNTTSSVAYNEHVETHRVKTNKIIVSVPDFKKYFVQHSEHQWRYEINSNGLKGLLLPSNVKICVMCREICTDEDRMREHIEIDHAPEREVKKLYCCICGEEFFNRVLLRHHIFKLGGDHKSK